MTRTLTKIGKVKMYKTIVNLKVACIAMLLAFGGSPSWGAPKGSPWAEGYFPNVVLTDQDGKKVRFYDDMIKGKEVVINFIYTHCGDTCPLETANLSKVKKLLGDRVGKDIFFYSISIDPQHDTPDVLKSYAERFKAGEGWRFLSGKSQDVTLLRKKLGLFRTGVDAQKLNQHNTSIMVGNERTGQWVKRSPFDEPNSLAWLLDYSLSDIKQVRRDQGHESYKSAKTLPELSKGEDIFRFRCAACHSLDDANGLGPGLSGVTDRRDQAWLMRWIKSPDKLLAAKDPIALSLYKQFNNVLMPNLRLSDNDVKAVIQYLVIQAKP